MLTPLVMKIDIEFGWRAAVQGLAGLLGLIVLPLCAGLLAGDLVCKGLPAYGGSVVETAPAADLLSMRDLAGEGWFWLLAGNFAICGFTTSGLFQTHLIPHDIEYGFSETAMALYFRVMVATDIVGTLLSGWLCDRFNPGRLLAA